MARAFSTFDYRDVSQSTKVAADGTAQVIFGPVDPSHVWRVTRAMVATEGSALEGQANLYVGDPIPQNFRDGTATGTLDVAEYPAPLVVPGTTVVTIAWSGLTPGAVALAALQYEDLIEMALPDSRQLAGRVL